MSVRNAIGAGEPADAHAPPKGGRWGFGLAVVFVAAAYGLIALGGRADSVRNLSIVFASIMLEAAPFMLAGAVLGGLIEEFLSRERMTAVLPRREWLAVVAAAGMGVLFPVCECAIVPVVRRLARKGLPASAAIAYLLGGPIVNPVVAASTALAYGLDWRMPALRLALGYGIAVAAALLLGRMFGRTGIFLPEVVGPQARPPEKEHGCCHGHDHHHHENGCGHVACACGCGHDHHGDRQASFLGRVAASLRHALDDFMTTAPYLVAGAFIAALAQTYVERRLFVAIGTTPLLSPALMMLLAVLLNLCSEADAFIAASFRGLVPYSAQLAFLVIGPMFDIKLLLMYQGVFRKRAIVALAVLATVLVFVASVAVGLLWEGTA